MSNERKELSPARHLRRTGGVLLVLGVLLFGYGLFHAGASMGGTPGYGGRDPEGAAIKGGMLSGGLGLLAVLASYVRRRT